MRKTILAVAAAFVLPAAHAQEGKKGMEMKDMDDKHGAMHDKMHEKKKPTTHKPAAKKRAEKKGAEKKDEHGH